MPDSIGDLLRASVENAADPNPLEIAIPVFTPPLVMSLVKIKDVRAREAAMDGLDQVRDETERGLEAFARLLILACQHTTVTIGGEVKKRPRLGVELWQSIYGEEAQAPPSDVAAVFALYTDRRGVTDTVALMDHAMEYAEWSRTAALQAHRDVLGESLPGEARPATSQT